MPYERKHNMDTSRTTTVSLTCGYWTEESRKTTSSGDLLNATRAVAVRIASLCRMDIMSLSHCPTRDFGQCEMTVIYVNNGLSLSDIRSLMKSEIDNEPQVYWM